MSGLVLATLAGCATPEYRFEQARCQASYDASLPPLLESRVETDWRWVDVRTGRRACEVIKGRKRCWPEYRRSFRPFTYVRTVDLNQSRRDNLVALCTQEACLGKYGDLECDPEAGKP